MLLVDWFTIASQQIQVSPPEEPFPEYVEPFGYQHGKHWKVEGYNIHPFLFSIAQIG